ncbi:MAG: hypothetical protein WD534_17220 [Phycisphaeraceae bacterium]
MMIRKLVILVPGVALACVAAALPFAGLERFAGDAQPAVVAMATGAVAIGCFVALWRPTVLESYVKLASLAFFVLMLLGVLGILAQMDGSALALR